MERHPTDVEQDSDCLNNPRDDCNRAAIKTHRVNGMLQQGQINLLIASTVARPRHQYASNEAASSTCTKGSVARSKT